MVSLIGFYISVKLFQFPTFYLKGDGKIQLKNVSEDLHRMVAKCKAGPMPSY